MRAGSIAPRFILVALLLTVGAGLAVFATQPTRTSTTSSTAQTTLSTSAPATTSVSTGSNGTITFSSPYAYTAYYPDESYNISGFITPAPKLPDDVLITVGPQGSLIALDEVSVPVGPNGTFSYVAVVGYTWEMVGIDQAPFVITATDSYGFTGSVIFFVALPTCSPVNLSG